MVKLGFFLFIFFVRLCYLQCGYFPLKVPEAVSCTYVVVKFYILLFLSNNIKKSNLTFSNPYHPDHRESRSITDMKPNQLRLQYLRRETYLSFLRTMRQVYQQIFTYFHMVHVLNSHFCLGDPPCRDWQGDGDMSYTAVSVSESLLIIIRVPQEKNLIPVCPKLTKEKRSV